MPKAKAGIGSNRPPTYQAPALLNQANPVQNTWYNILGTPSAPIAMCRIYSFVFGVLTTGETLEYRIIADGETIPQIAAVAAVAGSGYYVHKRPTLTGDALDESTTQPDGQSFIIEGKSVYVQIRKTTAAGAGNLQACIMYGTYP